MAKKFRDLAAKIPSERRAVLDREVAKTAVRMRLRELREALELGNVFSSGEPSKTDKKGS